MAKFKIEYFELTKTFFTVEANSEKEAEKNFKKNFFENEQRGKSIHFSGIFSCRKIEEEEK